MNHYWLIQNLIKEYAREYRDTEGLITLDDYFLQLRNIVDGELTVRTLQERIDDYDADDSWNESVDA
jgi:hypothetical protein